MLNNKVYKDHKYQLDESLFFILYYVTMRSYVLDTRYQLTRVKNNKIKHKLIKIEIRKRNEYFKVKNETNH